jgi:hypothetical protein
MPAEIASQSNGANLAGAADVLGETSPASHAAAFAPDFYSPKAVAGEQSASFELKAWSLTITTDISAIVRMCAARFPAAGPPVPGVT